MKPFTRVAVVVLWLIALLQLVRFIAGWQITVNGAAVPLWLSAPVAGLAIMVWRERPRQMTSAARVHQHAAAP